VSHLGMKPPGCITGPLCGSGKEPRDNAVEGGSIAYTRGFAECRLSRLLDRFEGWLFGCQPGS
jgi:hypothetical protein